MFLADGLGRHGFVAAPVARTEDKHILPDQLAIVFVGSEHIDGDVGFGVFTGISRELQRQRAYHVVGFVAVDLQDGNAIGPQYVFYNRYAHADVFRRLFALCLVGRVGLVAERRTVGVEGHADVRRLLFFQHFVQRVAETHDGRCVLAFRVDTRVFDECVVRPVNERVGV